MEIVYESLVGEFENHQGFRVLRDGEGFFRYVLTYKGCSTVAGSRRYVRMQRAKSQATKTLSGAAELRPMRPSEGIRE